MDLINLILKNNKKCFIISPHLDDAVLSCGALLMKLSQKADVTIINIFTKAHNGPYTLSAKKYLQNSSNYKDATVLYKERLREDYEVLSKLKIKFINLGFTDALFRRKSKASLLGKIIPEIDHMYPTYRWHVIRRINIQDTTQKNLKQKLTKIIPKNSIVLVPFGIGNHADHQLSRKVCEESFKNLIFYSDFPYNRNIGKNQKKNFDYKKFELRPDISKKNALIKIYKTQFRGLFPKGKIPYHKEIFLKK